MAQDSRAAARGRFERWFEVEVVAPMADFQNPKQEWRRLASELFGTFFLAGTCSSAGTYSIDTTGTVDLVSNARVTMRVRTSAGDFVDRLKIVP